jgi:hypothetical protein
LLYLIQVEVATIPVADQPVAALVADQPVAAMAADQPVAAMAAVGGNPTALE